MTVASPAPRGTKPEMAALRPKAGNLDWLDYSRFMAAAAVMCFHYLANGTRRGVITSYGRFGWVSDAAEYGYLGVDLFFLISGFVITMSAEQTTSARFAVSRFVRLWPTFILCMTATALVCTLFGPPQFAVTPGQYLINFTIAAPYLGSKFVDRVYWTLPYEIAFYGLVWLTLVAAGFRRLELVLAAWLPIIAAGTLLQLSFPIVASYNALFIVGCLISLGRRQGWTIFRGGMFLLALAMAVYGAILRAHAISHHRGDFELNPRIVGCLELLFVMLFFLAPALRLERVRLPLARQIGLMTYPLYLLHAYIGYVIIMHFVDRTNTAWALPLLMLFMIGLAYAVTAIFERPMLPYLRATLNDWVSRLLSANGTIKIAKLIRGQTL